MPRYPAPAAAAVKPPSPRPVQDLWQVVGATAHEFTGYEFRTMVVNADELKASLLKFNEMNGGPSSR